MHSVNNRRNHDFQIRHFLIGACSTVDGAYALLCDLREDRKNALGMASASALKLKAKRLLIERGKASEDEVVRLEAEAEELEIEAMRETSENCLSACRDELAFIQKCMDLLEPHRLFKHLPPAEAHEAAQRGEWLGELMLRAENHLLTSGTIPTDDFKTVRMHPDFEAEIKPLIEKIGSMEAKQPLLSSYAPSALLALLEKAPSG